jgi:hypothetical protein
MPWHHAVSNDDSHLKLFGSEYNDSIAKARNEPIGYG